MFQSKKIINILVLILMILVFLGLLNLVVNEFNHGNICPELLGIPACYIIFGFVILAFFAHFTKNSKLFYVAASIPFVIAVIASTMQFFGNAECPKTDSGIPMCYLSFLFFTAIISLKYYSNHLKINN